ncbi:hypothetical protein ACXG8O_001061 [Citrobacter youngae]
MKKPAQAGFFMPVVCTTSFEGNRHPLTLFVLLWAASLFSQPPYRAHESHFLSLFNFFNFIANQIVTVIANDIITPPKTNKRNPDVRFDN